jgi:hypothetical protein
MNLDQLISVLDTMQNVERVAMASVTLAAVPSSNKFLSSTNMILDRDESSGSVRPYIPQAGSLSIWPSTSAISG